jgi:hypothetical protein
MFQTRQGDLMPGDFLPDADVFVSEVHRDAEGVWIDWSDGDCGYVTESTMVKVER